jgi:exodeoxyribonuclease VII small subunit
MADPKPQTRPANPAANGQEGAIDLNSLTYEQAVAMLEKVITRLESGDISLDESMKLFQQGMELARICSGQLAAIEQQITQLIVRTDGSIEEKPFGEETAG